VGIEGFYDQYQERVVDLTTRSKYGSLTGAWMHYFNPEMYTAIEGRASKGSENYKSVSGSVHGTDAWEFENRYLAGYDHELTPGQRYKVYIGLGGRYYIDEGKGEVTDTGFLGYDRRIFQLYMPIGTTYEFQAWGLTFSPNAEFDPLLYGYVNSRQQNISGGADGRNVQKTGFGIRGEFMMGQTDASGYGWQFGPFFRYWNMNNSDPDYSAAHDEGYPPGYALYEPHNLRWQVGAALRFLF
jgi:hypothetical protein